jgi:asparagine synthase (glutamine-hydrolysing)
MCGIVGIISRDLKADYRNTVARMSEIIAHRGPDGEGFLVSDARSAIPCTRGEKNLGSGSLNYLPTHNLSETQVSPLVVFGHRRLSIIDLSDAGHEPMCDSDAMLWITYNGEIYNYKELKEELLAAGYKFRSNTDTEVIIYAYRHWGERCVERFNGMWAFCLLDLEKKQCFASRDRLGVKPFYYVDHKKFFAFASEQKAFVKSGLINGEPDEEALHNYLVNGLLETSTSNFFKGVKELWPGHNLVYDLQTHKTRVNRYFDLNDEVTLENEGLSDQEIIARARELFEQSIRLRLRSDVEVGTCLSGGVDSSAIAVTISRLSSQPLHCFTASFKGQPFDEGEYAQLVADKIGAIQHSTEPNEMELMRDFDELIYSQDVPIWSTSTYAQHRVMGLARRNNIKVVLDGQGADELFTGYHHHFTAKWNNLLSKGKLGAFRKDIIDARVSLASPALFFLKEKLKARAHQGYQRSSLLKRDFIRSFDRAQIAESKSDVNEQLIDDITHTRLKIFLKCEDRCGMWHGVESRTPFADDKDLLSFMFSFQGNRKIQHGRLKYILREALKQDLPAKIYNRFDKRGFETPMLTWIGNRKEQMLKDVKEAGFDFVDYSSLDSINSPNASLQLLKLFVMARWKKVFQS